MNETILLVDDEEGIRKFLGISLQDLGYAVETAENGEQALEKFRDLRPAIMLTDIKMPGMDGIELLKRVKAENKETEVIMISGHGDMDLAIKSLKYEAADFVTKPINDEILEAALSRVTEKISMRRQIKEYTENLEQLVKEQTARHQQLFDEAPCFISVQDRNFTIVSANRRFTQAFGPGADSFCHKLYKHRDTPCDDCPVAKTFQDGQNHQHETVVSTKTGEKINVLIWTQPIRDLKGNIVQVMEMSTDITRIRQLQDHLTSLGLMLGSVSHGVKGMLTALDGGLYRLSSGIKNQDMDKITSANHVISDITGQIKSMVLDILYYAKSRELNWEPTNATALAERVASMVEPKAEQAAVAFTRDIDPNLGDFEADPNALSAALVNFLENAVDACASDTKKQSHAVTFRAQADTTHIRFEIEDNGLGMDRETREKIFTLFFSSKGKKGTGLGLFIANQAVEQHGGTIQVESEPGQGSRFTILLPRELPASAKCTPEGRQ